MGINIVAISALINDMYKSDFLRSASPYIPKCTGLNDVFLKFNKIREQEKEFSKAESIHFNVLNFFNIDERLHSRIIGFFLDKNETHGQNDLFLRKFVERLGYSSEGDWILTIEKQHIDIMLERKFPHSVIIIENKSNGAKDQCNQIYRYWYRAIYLKHLDNCDGADVYKIVYLTPNGEKLFTENTISRPADYPSDLPEKVPIRIQEWRFNHHITQWLQECLQTLPTSNFRMRDFINQYIDYWN